MEMNKELIERIKLAKSPEDLMLLAKENGIELSKDKANTYFAKLNPKGGVLADDELDDVVGGEKCNEINTNCEYYKNKDLNNEFGSGKCLDCFYYIDNHCRWLIVRFRELVPDEDKKDN